MFVLLFQNARSREQRNRVDVSTAVCLHVWVLLKRLNKTPASFTIISVKSREIIIEFKFIMHLFS